MSARQVRATTLSEDETMSEAVWLITGAQASGKSTVADLLSRRFLHGVHVRGGTFYR
jgi:adenylylsulfate kinase-like enzyme